MNRVREMSPVPSESDIVTIKDILNYPLFTLKIFGVFIEYDGGTFKLSRMIVGKLILNTIFAIFIIGNVTRIIVGFVTHDNFSDELMGRIVYAVVYISTIIKFPVLTAVTTKQIPEIQSNFSRFQRDFGFAADIRKMKRVVTTTFYVMIIGNLFKDVIVIVLTYVRFFDESGLFISRLLPFTYNDGHIFDLVSAIDLVTISGCSFIMASEMVIAIVLSQIIVKEFQELNKKMDLAKENDDIPAFKLQRLRHHHYEVTELLQTANSIIQLHVFFIYLILLPSLCFTIYGIVYSNLGIFDIVSLVSVFLTFLLGMILMTWIGARIHSQAHSGLRCLFGLSRQTLPLDAHYELQIFIAQLSSQTIGINVFGLFTIDGSTFLMMFGTVVTYTFVVLQFHAGSGDVTQINTCNCTT